MNAFKAMRNSIQVKRYDLHGAVCNGAISKDEYSEHNKKYIAMVRFIDTLYRLDII